MTPHPPLHFCKEKDMPLSWDLTKIEDYKKLCFVKNGTTPEDKIDMNPITEVLIFATAFIQMNNITTKTYKEFHSRLKEFEIATGMRGLVVNTETKEYRMPTLEEVKYHIGLTTNATTSDKRKWGNEIRRIVKSTAKENAARESTT